jgi:hypothetical protein
MEDSKANTATTMIYGMRVGIITYLLLLGLASLATFDAHAFQTGEMRSEDVKGSTQSSSSSERERVLLERILKLERRVAELESLAAHKASAESTGMPSATAAQAPGPAGATPDGRVEVAPNQIAEEDRGTLNFFRDATFNVTLDGYYSYNFNRPAGRINLSRAYDVSHNSFSLNQAAIIIERTPNVETGRRLGMRLDIQYGQATETVQGSAANELRPQVYRPIWQAYGSYVAPVGSGLNIDFGKWASSLGIEGNYTKDQWNYSRSYYFLFLPFYHMGVRTSYAVNDKLNVTHWLVNGAQQSEDFNGFKSQAALLNIKPMSGLSWNVNYYTGLEGRDTVPAPNPGIPALPTQPGLSIDVIRPAPNGRLHILDTYVTWNATERLALAAEADYVINRAERNSPPSRVSGGAAYARYQFTPKFALAARGEYLSDRGGLFSGMTQALKETTLTTEYRIDNGFLARGEWRRDFSNQPFFLTDVPGVLKREQNTATIGLIWWFGRKEGAW